MKKRHGTAAFLLAVIVLLACCGLDALAEAAAGPNNEIVAFGALEQDIQTQTVARGTPLTSLRLPQALDVALRAPQMDSGSPASLPVTWRSSPAYQPDVLGSYAFAPVLPQGYTAAPGVTAPGITVQVSDTLPSLLAAGTGGFSVTGGTAGQDYAYAANVLSIKSGAALTISGTTKTDRILVEPGVKANLTLKDLSVDVSDIGAAGGEYRPFDMAGAAVRLRLEGTNQISSPSYKAAIHCPGGSDLTVEGPGALTVTVGNRGKAAAIGGEDLLTPAGECGRITINGGTLNVRCELEIPEDYATRGAAIGGKGGGPIVINGGTVNASAGNNCVGIGSVNEQFKGITITGGKVDVKLLWGGPFNDMGVNSSLAPAIGWVGVAEPDVKILISGGTVNAKGNWGCAGIGGGRDGGGGTIHITGNANVTAQGGDFAAGIGGGYSQRYGGGGCAVTIDGNAKVDAKGGQNAAGIGGGGIRVDSMDEDFKVGTSGVILIAGNANVKAAGGNSAPGIGGGVNSVAGSTFKYAGWVEKISIMEDATVSANGTPPIGPGKLPGNSPSQEERFGAFISTVPGVDSPIEAINSLTVQGDAYVVKGDVALDRDFTVPEGKTLVLSPGATLTVPDGVTLVYPEGGLTGDTDGLINGGGEIIAGPDTKPSYRLTVKGGSGSGTFKEGAKCLIIATVPDGKTFDKWVITSGVGTLEDAGARSTYFVMGTGDASVEARCKDSSDGSSSGGSSSDSSSSDGSSSGGSSSDVSSSDGSSSGGSSSDASSSDGSSSGGSSSDSSSSDGSSSDSSSSGNSSGGGSQGWPVWTGGGHSGNGSGGGSSGKGTDKSAAVKSLFSRLGGLVNSSAASPYVDEAGALKAAELARETAKAVAASGQGGTASIVVKNGKSVSADTLRQLWQAAQKAGGTIRLHCDTVEGGVVTGRISIDPQQAANLAGTIQLGVRTDTEDVKATVELFAKHYSNRILALCLEQRGAFGMVVHVAVKADLGGAQAADLVFYAFDRSTNSFTRLEKASAWADNNGYLHFDTASGGDIVISVGALSSK